MVSADPYLAAGYVMLKVETHLHTVHSDGRDTVRDMLAACRDAGYDAVAVTDHNTVSGLPEARAVAEKLGLILIPGVELTTFHGHAVLLGIDEVPEWRNLDAALADQPARQTPLADGGAGVTRRGMDAVADEVHAAGGLVCIAHPAALGSPVCSGCAWEWPIAPHNIDLWEIFNAGRPHVDLPYALWRRGVSRGSRAAPIAAGDVHSAAAARAPRPATYVYVQRRTPEAVLDALRQRRLYSSSGAPLGFWLDAPDDTPPITSEAQNARGRSETHVAPSLAGEHAGPLGHTPRTSHADARIEYLDSAPGGRAVYAELRTPDGALEAISAPIWIDSET